MRNRVICTFVLAPVAVLLCLSSTASSDDAVRVALVVDTALGLDKSPLVSLLEVKLSQRDDLQLLERAELKKILKEHEMHLMFSSEGVGARLRVGKLLKADLLVLARAKDEGEVRKLDVVVAETEMGLRLFVRPIVWSDDPASCADAVSGLLNQALAKHKGTIRGICAVPPFVSKNLSHRHDYLQTAYAQIAELEVLRRPGCVVVELDEARAIARELAAASENSKVTRPLPYYILGEFRHDNAKPDSPVSITVRLQTNAKITSELSAQRVDAAGAVSFVRQTVGRMTAKLTSSGTQQRALPNAKEVETLLDRARVFQAAGEYEKANALCEAALLLDPGNNNIREQIIEICSRILHVRLPDRMPEDYYRTEWQKRLRYVLRSGQHLSVLVRRKNFSSFRELKSCIRKVWTALDSVQQAQISYHVKSGMDEELAEITQAYRDFVLRDFPHTWRPNGWPDLETRSKEGIGSNWCGLVPDFDYRGYGRYTPVPTRADFDYRLRLARKVLADVPGSGRYLRDFVKFGYGYPQHLKNISQEVFQQFDNDYNDFLNQLIASKKPVLELVGKCGRLKWKYESGLEKLTPEALEEIKRAIQECPDGYVRASLQDTLREVRIQYLPKRSRLRKDSSRTALKEEDEPRPAVTYEPLRIHFMNVDGGNLGHTPRWREAHGSLTGVVGLVRCAEGVDVLWSHGAVCFMEKRDQAQEILADSGLFITDVCWDGEWLWAATQQGRLLLIDLQKKSVRSIGFKEGVPESGIGMVVCPLESGKVCAVGAFPPHSRGWCAIVTKEGKVEVFHEARRVLKTRDDIGQDLAFRPTWAIPVPDPSNPKVVEKVIVGRQADVRYSDFKMMDVYPLVIDVGRLRVSTADFRLTGSASRELPNGLILKENMLIAGGRNWSDMRAVNISTEEMTWVMRREWNRTGELIEWDGKILAPAGERWFEIDPQNLEVKALSAVNLPDKYDRIRHFRSWHYGILARRTVSPGDFFQVTPPKIDGK